MIVSNLASQEIKFKNIPDFNGYSVGHFIGGEAGYFGIRIFKVKPFWCIVGSTLIGFSYEIINDGMGVHIFPFTGNPDPKGADLIGDLGMHFLGACFGAITEASIKLLSSKILFIKRKNAMMIRMEFDLNGGS